MYVAFTPRMHKSRLSSHRGDYILYGGAQFSWVLSMEHASPFWRLEFQVVF